MRDYRQSHPGALELLCQQELVAEVTCEAIGAIDNDGYDGSGIHQISELP
jgi:hypothetical protein